MLLAIQQPSGPADMGDKYQRQKVAAVPKVGWAGESCEKLSLACQALQIAELGGQGSCHESRLGPMDCLGQATPQEEGGERCANQGSCNMIPTANGTQSWE